MDGFYRNPHAYDMKFKSKPDIFSNLASLPPPPPLLALVSLVKVTFSARLIVLSYRNFDLNFFKT